MRTFQATRSGALRFLVDEPHRETWEPSLNSTTLEASAEPASEMGGIADQPIGDPFSMPLATVPSPAGAGGDALASF